MLKKLATLLVMVALFGIAATASAGPGKACEERGEGRPPICGPSAEGARGHNGDGTYTAPDADGDGTVSVLGARRHNGDGTY